MLAAALLWTGSTPAHEVYIGYGQFEVSGAQFSGQLAYNKLDLLQALARLNGGHLYSLAPPEFEQLTLRYVRKHFQVTADEDTLRLEITQRSQKDDNVILNVRCTAVTELGRLTVRNDVLFELFPDQVNTLVVQAGTDRGRYVFHPERPVIELAF